MKTTIEARLRIVTPMFIGDATQKASSIRPPSIKGALRFWWRALNWARCLKEEPREAAALQLLHQREAELFGSATKDGTGGQANFILDVEQPKSRRLETSWPINNTGSGYLGYGLMESGQPHQGNYKPHREALREGLDFLVRFCFLRPGLEPPTMQASLIEAIEAWSLFGGLGSRSRRGFGSVTLLRLDGENKLMRRQQYEERVSQILSSAAQTPKPPFTAFSDGSKASIIADGSKPRHVHAQAGLAYRQHRGQESSLRGRTKIPFGLPLQNVDRDSRRGSPLFFHIHELAGGSYIAALLHLPAVFHPKHLDVSFRHVKSFVTNAEVIP